MYTIYVYIVYGGAGKPLASARLYYVLYIYIYILYVLYVLYVCILYGGAGKPLASARC